MMLYRKLRITTVLTLILLVGLTAGTLAQTSSTKDHAAVSKEAMATTAHPLATAAAVQMLRQGGNAVDAAVAAAFAIGVVEPDGSGIGGGGGMVIYLAQAKRAVYINYYQRSSEAVTSISYNPQTDNRSAKAVLVPGTVDGLITALEKYGTLPLGKVLEPAIRYADEGFAIDATLAQIILDNTTFLQKYPSTAATFLRDGFPMSEGDTLVQKDLAATLRDIAARGRAGFYDGRVAATLVKDVNENGGALTLADLRKYKSIVSEPVRGNYRGYEVLSANAPQSGAFVVESLNILENADLHAMGNYAHSTDAMHLMAETLRRAYADRGAFLDDPSFEHVPVRGLTSKAYAASRYHDIDMTAVTPSEYRKTKAGNPLNYENSGSTSQEKSKTIRPSGDDSWGDTDTDELIPATTKDNDIFDSWGGKRSKRAENHNADTVTADSSGDNQNRKEMPDPPEGGHTTHLAVMDKDGNTVSLTQTLGTFFGSGLYSAGVMLNCGMANFSTTTAVNAVKPDKQPRSSIAPTIILKDGQPVIAVGSPGAARIIATVVELIVNMIDYGMPVDEANNAPRFLCLKSDDYLSLESRIDKTVQDGLEKRGHRLKVFGEMDLFFGGAQIIMYDPVTKTYYGSADPRRGGVAIGD
jgi:gamma-glutamyltranspeptidase / glutathione hydrolase